MKVAGSGRPDGITNECNKKKFVVNYSISVLQGVHFLTSGNYRTYIYYAKGRIKKTEPCSFRGNDFLCCS